MIKITSDGGNAKRALDKAILEFKRLNRLTVKVGAFKANGGRSESYMELIAMANEYGVPHIRPINAQWLTIPTKLAGTKKASEIPGLFKPRGKNILAKANPSGGLDVYFILSKDVTIPKRPFLQNAFDENATSKWANILLESAAKIPDGEMTADEVFAAVGRQMVKDVHKAIAVMKPDNAPATIARKGKNNPLIDTGALFRSIAYEVTEK